MSGDPPKIHDFREDPTKFPAYVSIVLHDQGYGGPEEGGWYYHTIEKIESRRALDGLAVAGIIAEFYNNPEYDNIDRPDIGSVLSRGRYEIHVTQGPIPSHQPTYRPRYE